MWLGPSPCLQGESAALCAAAFKATEEAAASRPSGLVAGSRQEWLDGVDKGRLRMGPSEMQPT